MTKVEAGRLGGLASIAAKRRRKDLAAALAEAGVDPSDLLERLRWIYSFESFTADLEKIDEKA